MGDDEEILKKITETGFRCIEVLEGNLTKYCSDLSVLKDMLQKYSAEMMSVCVGANFIYQDALEAELTFLKIPFEREKRLQVVYKGVLLKSDFYADFVCYDSIIVELKAVAKLMPAHKAQVLNYLNASGLEVGLLVNFGEPSLKFERISKFKKQPALTNPPPF